MLELLTILCRLKPAMDVSSSLGIRVALLGAGLGLAGQALFYSAGVGVNVAIWILAVVLGFVMAMRWPTPSAPPAELGFASVLVLGAVGVVLNDSPWVVGLNLALILATFGLYALRTASPGKVTLGKSFAAVVLYWAQFWLEAFKLRKDVKWDALKVGTQGGNSLRAVGRGVALAIPALLIFVGLLASADPIFSRALSPQMNVDADQVVSRTTLAVLMGLFAMGLLRRAVWTRFSPPVQSVETGERTLNLGWIEFVTVFAMLSFVLVAFMTLQARYLFGGTDLVLQTEGLSFASYARRGFFELVTLVAISVPILLGAYGLVKSDSLRQLGAVKWTSVAFMGLVGAVLISAARRMHLYVDAYGLSELRFYVSAAMLWLAVLVGAVVYGVGRSRLSRLPRTLAFTLVAAVAGLSVSNPDRLIAEYNLNRTSGEVTLDHSYLSKLGGGAVPPLLDALPQLPESQRAAIWKDLQGRYGTADRDWRDWNFRQSSARESFRRAARVTKL